MSDSRTPRRTRGWYVRGVVGLAGELLVTLGVVLALFVGWQVLWTDVVADREQSAAVSALEDRFAVPPDPPAVPDPTIPPGDSGDAFAVIRIPRFGADYARPLYEGTDRLTLQRGIGHYTATAQPGEVGNFALAGHRTPYGKPFSRIAELRVGDRVIVETAASYFVYRVYDDLVVLPTQVEVVLPVPGERTRGGAVRAAADHDQLPPAVQFPAALGHPCPPGADARPVRRPAGGTAGGDGLMSLYGFVWRHLPGPLPVKVLLAVLLVIAVVAALFAWVFPALEPYLPGNDITVEG